MENISIIGAGTMGRGIALSCLEAGYIVKVQDVNEESFQVCRQYIEKYSDKKSIIYTTDLKEAAQEADLIIEAVLEVMDLKIAVFKELDKYAPKKAILATNTSTMSPTEIAAQTSRPAQCIALHFFNPGT